MLVSLFENAHYSHGIALTQKWDRKVVITLNARNDHDRSVFRHFLADFRAFDFLFMLYVQDWIKIVIWNNCREIAVYTYIR